MHRKHSISRKFSTGLHGSSQGLSSNEVKPRLAGWRNLIDCLRGSPESDIIQTDESSSTVSVKSVTREENSTDFLALCGGFLEDRCVDFENNEIGSGVDGDWAFLNDTTFGLRIDPPSNVDIQCCMVEDHAASLESVDDEICSDRAQFSVSLFGHRHSTAGTDGGAATNELASSNYSSDAERESMSVSDDMSSAHISRDRDVGPTTVPMIFGSNSLPENHPQAAPIQLVTAGGVTGETSQSHILDEIMLSEMSEDGLNGDDRDGKAVGLSNEYLISATRKDCFASFSSETMRSELPSTRDAQCQPASRRSSWKFDTSNEIDRQMPVVASKTTRQTDVETIVSRLSNLKIENRNKKKQSGNAGLTNLMPTFYFDDSHYRNHLRSFQSSYANEEELSRHNELLSKCDASLFSACWIDETRMGKSVKACAFRSIDRKKVNQMRHKSYPFLFKPFLFGDHGRSFEMSCSKFTMKDASTDTGGYDKLHGDGTFTKIKATSTQTESALWLEWAHANNTITRRYANLIRKSDACGNLNDFNESAFLENLLAIKKVDDSSRISNDDCCDPATNDNEKESKEGDTVGQHDDMAHIANGRADFNKFEEDELKIYQGQTPQKSIYTTDLLNYSNECEPSGGEMITSEEPDTAVRKSEKSQQSEEVILDNDLCGGNKDGSINELFVNVENMSSHISVEFNESFDVADMIFDCDEVTKSPGRSVPKAASVSLIEQALTNDSESCISGQQTVFPSVMCKSITGLDAICKLDVNTADNVHVRNSTVKCPDVKLESSVVLKIDRYGGNNEAPSEYVDDGGKRSDECRVTLSYLSNNSERTGSSKQSPNHDSGAMRNKCRGPICDVDEGCRESLAGVSLNFLECRENNDEHIQVIDAERASIQQHGKMKQKTITNKTSEMIPVLNRYMDDSPKLHYKFKRMLTADHTQNIKTVKIITEIEAASDVGTGSIADSIKCQTMGWRDFKIPYSIMRDYVNNRYSRKTRKTWFYHNIQRNVYFDTKPQTRSKANRCDCTISSESLLGCGDQCLNRVILTECSGDSCPSGACCTNRNIQENIFFDKNLEIFDTNSKRGYGVISKVDISAKTMLTEYVGEVITGDEFKRRLRGPYKKDTHHFSMNIDTDAVVDAYRMGGIARFFNHSCNPNCDIQQWNVKGQSRMCVFSSKSIAANEELTYNYKFRAFSKSGLQKCYCMADCCTGSIGSTMQENTIPAKTAPEFPLYTKSRVKWVMNPAVMSWNVFNEAAVRRCFLHRNMRSIFRAQGWCTKAMDGPCDDIPDVDYEAIGNLSKISQVKVWLKSNHEIPDNRKFSISQRYTVLQSLLSAIVKDLIRYQTNGCVVSNPFMRCPSISEIPMYYDLVSNPIDMTHIQAKVRSGVYLAFGDFHSDFLLLLRNVIRYTGRQHEVSGPILAFINMYRILCAKSGWLLPELQGIKNAVLAAGSVIIPDDICRFYDVRNSVRSIVHRSVFSVDSKNCCLLGVPATMKPLRGRPLRLNVIKCACKRHLDETECVQCMACKSWSHLECLDAKKIEQVSSGEYMCDSCNGFIPPTVVLARENDPDEAGTLFISTFVNGINIKLGSYYYINPVINDDDRLTCVQQLLPLKNMRRIGCIIQLERIYIPEGSKAFMVRGTLHIRPEHTFHEPNRRFFRNEVFRSPIQRNLRAVELGPECYVLDLTTFLKGKPREASDLDIYVCEHRMDKGHRVFYRIKRNKPIATNTKAYCFEQYICQFKPRREYVPHDQRYSQVTAQFSAEEKGKIESFRSLVEQITIYRFKGYFGVKLFNRQFAIDDYEWLAPYFIRETDLYSQTKTVLESVKCVPSRKTVARLLYRAYKMPGLRKLRKLYNMHELKRSSESQEDAGNDLYPFRKRPCNADF